MHVHRLGLAPHLCRVPPAVQVVPALPRRAGVPLVASDIYFGVSRGAFDDSESRTDATDDGAPAAPLDRRDALPSDEQGDGPVVAHVCSGGQMRAGERRLGRAHGTLASPVF